MRQSNCVLEKDTKKKFTTKYAVFFNVLLYSQILVGTCTIKNPVTWLWWKLNNVCLHLPYILIIRIPVYPNRYLFLVTIDVCFIK